MGGLVAESQIAEVLLLDGFVVILPKSKSVAGSNFGSLAKLEEEMGFVHAEAVHFLEG